VIAFVAGVLSLLLIRQRDYLQHGAVDSAAAPPAQRAETAE
jgi:hypothetical protein